MLAAALAVLYAALLIPDPEAAGAGTGQPAAQVFAWDRDAYWRSLETAFSDLRREGCAAAEARLATRFREADGLLRQIERNPLGPDAKALGSLERLMFESGPLVGACGGRISDYLRLAAESRRVVKKRSADWDLAVPGTREALYRILYGSRAAVEEVILQMPVGAVPGLQHGTDEASQAPGVEVRGVRVHSGDILVSRGGAPTSALIARGSDYPGNFSHIALAYVDPATRSVYAVEAHIESGVRISTLEEYLAWKNPRIMVLRPRADLAQLQRDPLLPHKAAERAYRRAKQAHIPYDFAMDFRDHGKMFCSEVASAAYEEFGVRLWMGISRISSPGLRRWLGGLGVRYFETEEPSDLEYDPQLAVVAEWRDPQTLRKDHYDNAVTEAMLEGAERGDELAYRLLLLPPARLAKAYSAALNLFGRVGPIPEGMSATQSLRSVWYTARHQAIGERLAGKAERFRQQRQYEPPYWELVRLARAAKDEIGGE